MRSMVVFAFVAASLALVGCADVATDEPTSSTSAQDVVAQDGEGDDGDGVDDDGRSTGLGIDPSRYVEARALGRYTGDDRAGTHPIPWQPGPTGSGSGSSKND